MKLEPKTAAPKPSSDYISINLSVVRAGVALGFVPRISDHYLSRVHLASTGGGLGPSLRPVSRYGVDLGAVEAGMRADGLI